MSHSYASRRALVGLGLILFVVAATAARDIAAVAQTTPTSAANSGLLMGVVVDAAGDHPVAGAQVTLSGAGTSSAKLDVLTDGDGHFIFMDLPKGSYTLTATRAGYADGALGRRRPGGLLQTLTLADGERLADLRVPIWKLAAITGRVVDDAGEPMVNVPVRALARTITAGKRRLTPDQTARTDDRGIYRLASLIPGDYAIVVSSTQASAPQSVVDLYYKDVLDPANGREFARDMSMDGVVTALSLFQRYGGVRVGPLALLPTAGPARAGVSPGPGADGRLFVHPTLFYPDTLTAADAGTIAVESGEERHGVDLRLRLVPASRVSGTVTGPDGALIAVMTLTPDSDDLSTDATLETATTLSDASGRFTFLGVPTGRYQLRAYRVSVPASGASRGAPPPPPAAAGRAAGAAATGPTGPRAVTPPGLSGYTLWATQPMTVGESDIDGLAITLRAGFRISGRAVFTGARAQPDADQIHRITAVFEPIDARPLVTSVIANGQFDESGQLSTYQMPPGRYFVRIVNPPPGWTLDSAIVNNRDISNVPLTLERDVVGVTINFTDRPGAIFGQVQSAGGGPDASATVLIFPADPSAWTDTGRLPRRLRSIRVDRDGQYRVTELPAGDYRIIAIVEEATMNWQDPQTLQALARVATTVTLGPNETRTLSLRTTSVPR